MILCALLQLHKEAWMTICANLLDASADADANPPAVYIILVLIL